MPKAPSLSRAHAPWAVVLLVGFLVAPACAPTEPGPCGMTDVRTKGGDGAACNVAEDCDLSFGCVQDRCASCTDSSQCGEFLACDDGTCTSCSAAVPCRDGETCVNGYCLPEIRVWDLTIDPDDWATLQEEIYDDDLYFDCELQVDGVAYEGCRARIQGASSRYYDKKSVRLLFPEDSVHPGFSRKINLRSEWADSSYLRTWLGYASFRRLTRTPTVRSRHLFLRVNGEDFGLMNEVERLGGRFLSRHGRDRDQSLYEAESAPPMGAFVPMPDAAAYRWFDDHLQYTKKGGDPDDYRDLISLVEDVLWADFQDSPSRVTTTIERTEQHVAMAQQVEYLALQSVLQNRDHIQSNFHFSRQRDVDGRMRWEFYPWDLDTTFGCHRPDGADQTLCDVMTHDVWPFGGVGPTTRPVGWPEEVWMNMVIHLTLNELSCSTSFVLEVCRLLDTDWWQRDVPALAWAMSEHLHRWLPRDERDRNSGYADFEDAVANVAEFPALRAEFLRSELGCF